MKCCKCGTTNLDDFHFSSIIGHDIAEDLESQGCDYWDFKTNELLCIRCYYKSVGKEFNEETWRRIIEKRQKLHRTD